MRLQALTEFDYHPTLARTPGASLVLFSSPDCGSCRKVENLLATALGAAGDAGDIIRACYKVNVQQDTALARQYDLFHLPALFLYKEGIFHAVLHCEAAPDKLRRAIATALSMPAQEEP